MNWTVGQIKRVVVNDIGGHEFIDISLLPGINLITGGNGSGKSSLVSAIALLCGWSGRKAGKDTNLNKYIRIGANKGVVRIHFSNNDSNFQKGYLNDVYGDEIIVERTIYLKGTSNYTFKGSKTNSPIYKSLNAKNHLSKFRAYANIIVNNPVTFLTQADAKYLIREQNSPKSLYDFFQRVHFFDYSWERLAEEQRHIERAEIISMSLNNELKHLECELKEYRKVDELIQLFKKLCTYEKSIDSISILTSIKKSSSSINSLRNQYEKLNNARSALDIEKLDAKIRENYEEINSYQSELNNLRSEYELSFNEHKMLSMELEQVCDRLTSHFKHIQEVKVDIENTEKEIALFKVKENCSLNANKKKIDLRENILEEIKTCKEKANILNLKKENLISLSINKKNEISALQKEIKEVKAELGVICDEKQSFELKLNEIKNMLESNRKSLESIDYLNDFPVSNSTIVENFSNLSNMINDSENNHSQEAIYSKLYNNFTDKDFETIFGYSKSVHSKVIKQFEQNGDLNVQGPIALYIFSKHNTNEKIINILDEVIGGRLEGQDTRSGYKIRRNYKYWLVQNSKIKRELILSFKNNGVILDPSLIFIRSSFDMKKYDLESIRKRYPKVGLPVIDLLHIESNEIFNFLIDNFQIETTFIFLNDHDMDLIYDYSFNVRRAHSLNNYSFKYRRGGIVVAPEISVPKQSAQYKVVLRQLSSSFNLKNDVCYLFSNQTEGKNNLPEKAEMKKHIECNLLENERKTVEIKTIIAELEEKSNILKLSINNNSNKLGNLCNEASSIEIELNNTTTEEHSVNMKIGELEVERQKLDREKDNNHDINFSEINELFAKLSVLNKLLVELEAKIGYEEKLKETKEADIEKLKIVIDRGKELIKLKEDKHKNLKIDNNALLNKKPMIENEMSEITGKMNKLNTEINSKIDELASLKIKYQAMNSGLCNNKHLYIGDELFLTDDLCSTLEYMNWNYSISGGAISSLPDISTTELWKSKISRQKDTVYIDIIERSKDSGLDISENYNSETLFEKVLEKIKDKSRKYDAKMSEYQEENELLKKNKIILNKRIQQLQKNHIRCGKDVNSQFKHYFSIFWSNTMRPHLKFDHEKSTLNIYVIPDTASMKKSKIAEGSLSPERNLVPPKDQHRNFVSREIQSLSGGESSSIGISLLLALSQNTSSPFHLFDEPDVYMDEIRRITTIQSLIEFERLCSRGNRAFDRQVLFITPHSEIIPHIKENYSNLVHIIQLIKR